MRGSAGPRQGTRAPVDTSALRWRGGRVSGELALRAIAAGYLGLFLVVPLAAVARSGVAEGLAELMDGITQPAALAALKLTLWTAALMTAINAVMGTLTAYVLVRCDFPCRSLVNAVVDVPFAVPTLVTGVMLVVLYGPQAALGGWLLREAGVQIIFAPPGIVLALLFVCLPFVVRTVQPVLMAVDQDHELAALTLGASPLTAFRRVLLPALAPAIITGSLLSFARALGEFGSIAIVAGNIPFRSQTAAVYVLTQIESDDQTAASGVSLALVGIAFAVMIAVDAVTHRRSGVRG